MKTPEVITQFLLLLIFLARDPSCVSLESGVDNGSGVVTILGTGAALNEGSRLVLNGP